MGRQLWSIQLYFSDDSSYSIPVALHELVRFIKVRRETEGNTIRKTRPANMWVLEYAIHKAQTFGDNKHICKVMINTEGRSNA